MIAMEADGGEKCIKLIKYDSKILLGECIRNCCVNLGIDPDTVDGITRNVQVTMNRHMPVSQTKIKVSQALEESVVEDGSLLVFHELY